MFPSGGGGDSSSVGAVEVADLQEVRFVDFLNGLGVFAGGSSEGF